MIKDNNTVSEISLFVKTGTLGMFQNVGQNHGLIPQVTRHALAMRKEINSLEILTTLLSNVPQFQFI
jgi:hypothetical protein